MAMEMQRYLQWMDRLKGDTAFHQELAALKEDEAEIADRFYRDLSFGTAGLRGVLGLGTNRMNIFTVRRATQAMARYLLDTFENPSAAIAYDSRINSTLFAQETACVFAANGIKVYLYEELMPTPALSYAVRELHCSAGVVITASHNPAKYNGYKAYDPDGCQIGQEVADKVLAAMEAIDVFDGAKYIPLQEGFSSGMLQYIPESFIQRYLDRVLEEALQPGICGEAQLNLVYTPLNGAGNRCVREVLRRMGVKNVTVVPEQEMPDGNFPTCPYPNPETREALELGLKLCEKTDGDMLLATDPDADRVAVAVKAPGGYQVLSGNEVGVLLLDYICRARHANGCMPQKPVAVKSIVSSPMADRLAEYHNVEMVNVLTGFKFIGEVIAGLEEKGEADRFIFGFEESCGYLSGGFVRDKDAVNATVLLVEMASSYKSKGKTLLNVLEELYQRHGIYRVVVNSSTFEGADGMVKMAAIMEALRKNPPADFGGDSVCKRLDYKHSVAVEAGEESKIDLPSSDVLEYKLENGSSIIVRPSGTEPKIKIYYSLAGKTEEDILALSQKYAAFCQSRIGIS